MGKTRATRGVQGIPKRQMNIRIEEASVEKLKGLAAASGESLNAAATRILEEAIGRPAAAPVPETVDDPMSLYPLPEKLRRLPGRGRAYRVACWSPKGGTGKTSVAVGLGHYLAWGTAGETGRTLLVDLGEFGEAYMQSEAMRQQYGITDPESMPSVRGLLDAVGGMPPGTASWDDVRGHLAVDDVSGLCILLPAAVEDGETTPGAAAYASVLGAVEHLFDFVVFDCGPHLPSFAGSGLTAFALGTSDRTIVVGDQTFPTIIHTVKYFAKIVKKSKDLPAAKGSYAYVVNRYNPAVPSSMEEIRSVMEKFVGSVIAIPAAHDDAMQAAYDGTSLIFMPRKDVKLAYRELAAWLLTGLTVEPLNPARPPRTIAAIEE